MLNSFSPPKKSPGPVCREERGFAVLEALVAMLVFALGILGLIGLQGTMTREQTTSKLRADAAYLASEMVGLMWTDIPNLSLYASGSCNGYPRCADWATKVGNVLPSGSSTVVVNPANGDITVTVTWVMPGGDEHQYVTATTIVKSETS